MIEESFQFPLLPHEITTVLRELVESNRILSRQCRELGLPRVIGESEGVVLFGPVFAETLTRFRQMRVDSYDPPLLVVYEDFDEAIDLYQELALRNTVLTRRIETTQSKH